MKAEINVTPLIDVLLVLLIIFMLVAPVAPSALDASLPEPSREAGVRPAGVTLSVEAASFTLDGVPLLTPEAASERLRAALASSRERTVFVRVADGVSYSRVVDAVDLARGCGAERIGLVDAVGETDAAAGEVR